MRVSCVAMFSPFNDPGRRDGACFYTTSFVHSRSLKSQVAFINELDADTAPNTRYTDGTQFI